ncbi:hypothetical protein VNO80_31562 [Phaseolus coccineus]|uniref:Uncharacterized protein n=1 Tax=Phaseolus coccineus TaxID=3886 RepID=A0AAN9Q9R3_PHACN
MWNDDKGNVTWPKRKKRSFNNIIMIMIGHEKQKLLPRFCDELSECFSLKDLLHLSTQISLRCNALIQCCFPFLVYKEHPAIKYRGLISCKYISKTSLGTCVTPNSTTLRGVLYGVDPAEQCWMPPQSDEFAGRIGDGVFDGVKGVEAGEDVDLAEHSPAFAGVGDGDDVVIDERGENGGDGAFNVADGVTVDVADVDGVGVVRVVGSRRRRTKERPRMVAQ